jgi:asparaginyl-tRNA synthetase
VYTFGPTFRAENSNTYKHLAEFWMIEPEFAFADINDNVRYAVNFIKFCVKKAMDCCPEDLAFFERVRARYLAQARREPGRFCVLDGGRSIAEVQASIERVIARHVG